ncbi:MAG: hypothetical protein ACE366_17925 [Bradymonadia bacterium]
MTGKMISGVLFTLTLVGCGGMDSLRDLTKDTLGLEEEKEPVAYGTDVTPEQKAQMEAAEAEKRREEEAAASASASGGMQMNAGMAGMVKMPEMPQMPQMRQHKTGRQVGSTQSNQSSSSSAHCCVNKRYYTCKSAADAAQCLGEPMNLMNCLGKCTGGPSCEETCMRKHGPDTRACDRDSSRDGECRR